MSSVGERIRQARRRKGLTQKELAAEVGCSQQTIVDIESQDAPRSRFLSSVVRVLGESLEWIETGRGGPTALSGGLLPHYDLETAALRALDPELVDQVIDYLFSPPVEMSDMAFTVLCDENCAALMDKHVSDGCFIFVDPLADLDPGQLVLAVMPGFDRAELRQYRIAGAERYLLQDSDLMGKPSVQITPYRSVDDYMAHGEVTAPGAALPCLIVGVVVYKGMPC